MDMKPSDRARAGIVLCPERRRLFSESSVMEGTREELMDNPDVKSAYFGVS
jgi:ABC-type branched-subunit amino acid transport system ATPase component